MINTEPQGCGDAPICVTTWSNGNEGGIWSALPGGGVALNVNVKSPHRGPPDFAQVGQFGPVDFGPPVACIPSQCGGPWVPPVDPRPVESPGTLALMGAVLVVIGAVVLRRRAHT